MVPGSAEGKGIRCPHCGITNLEGVSVCRSCHQPLSEESVTRFASKICPHCGFDRNPLIAKFCMKCGAEISDTEEIFPAEPPAALMLPTRREIPVSVPETIVGRKDFLEDMPPEKVKFVSREHLKIVCEGGEYFIIDERSTNGTKLNGVEIKGKGMKRLKDNDKIVLANTVDQTFQMK
ncbi:MAG: FHA domain-containing protein [Theionarchaea archaeon]|nr:FHA domain-containing protein [Theionarchaea archaeon]